jgi:phosphoribosylformimino-5-aminoimidazole carboxamide ribotide isomerase
MRFRPCIDIHNGQVKQIVGGSLTDLGDYAQENFVSEQDGAYYAKLYQKHDLHGGHVILLNKAGTQYYDADVQQAKAALSAYPNGLMVGGGITADNAKAFLDAGASHVIVTSYVFRDGRIDYDHLQRLHQVTGSKRLVLDLSCRFKDGQYYIVTDRWQNFTSVAVTAQSMKELASYCDEFLIHAVDVEGKASGIERDLVRILADNVTIPITYAGGVGSYDDILCLKELGHNRIDVTIGSALDLFGGKLKFEKVLELCG